MTDETPDKRRINDDPVVPPPALVPARSILTGSMVQLEPIDPDRHTSALFCAGHASEAARVVGHSCPGVHFRMSPPCTRSCAILPPPWIACSMQSATGRRVRRSVLPRIWTSSLRAE